MNIVFVASECAPFIKSGGLADVAQALPKALAKEKNNTVSVFLPFYSKIKYSDKYNFKLEAKVDVYLSWRKCYCGVFKYVSKSKKLNYYFIDNEYYFNRPSLYGDYDDGERFAYFSKAVIEAINTLQLNPDIIHCNDWQTALIPLLIKQDPFRYGKVKTVFTIHNIEYQGIAQNEFCTDVLGVDGNARKALEFDNCINFLKGAIISCDKLTTVSKTYANEILDPFFSHRLEKILFDHRYKLSGIVNGIDTDVFNPETDKNVYVPYSADDISGKKECKKKLQEELGLEVNENVPIVAIISRLASHKGFELIERVLREILDMNLQLVVLGSGEPEYEGAFKTLSYLYPHKVSANIKFSVSLASKIYSGADFLLMPSKQEPCGLSQLIAMRYGVLPIVRETGGLKDTVPPINPMTTTGRGFTFYSYNAHDMLYSIQRAMKFYYEDREKFNKIQIDDMKFDSSWNAPVKEYMNIYNALVNNK